MAENKVNEELIELMAYLLTSARGLMDEPANYGPFRLIDGASRLCTALSDNGYENTEFLSSLQLKIDERKFSVMSDFEEFRALADEAVHDITLHLIEKNNSEYFTKK